MTESDPMRHRNWMFWFCEATGKFTTVVM